MNKSSQDKPDKPVAKEKPVDKDKKQVDTKAYYALAKDSKGVLSVLEFRAAVSESELNVLGKTSFVNSDGEKLTLIDVTTKDDYTKHKMYLWGDVVFKSQGKRKYSALVTTKEGKKAILDFVLDAKKTMNKGSTMNVKGTEYAILELVEFRKKPERYYDWRAEANLKTETETEKDDD